MSKTEVYLLNNNRFTLSTISQEMRMSHWVDTPVITNNQTQEIILDLSNTSWHLLKWKETAFGTVMTLAKYPNLKNVQKIDCNFKKMVAHIGTLEFPIMKLTEVLERYE